MAVLCLATLTLGVVCLSPGALTRVRGRMSGNSSAGFFSWWPTQSVRAQEIGISTTGTFTTFEAPGAGTSAGNGTIAISIDAAGDIVGTYFDNSHVGHGFLRTAGGTITPLDAPGAGTSRNQGTFAISIDPGGKTITGFYEDANNAEHGFVLPVNGTITEFDVPGAVGSGHRGTQATSVNTTGEITGQYSTGSYLTQTTLWHGFKRATNGAITAPIDAPGAGAGTHQGTHPVSIDKAGDITGYYEDANGASHGFVLSANGTMTSPIDAPGASVGGGSDKIAGPGTIPVSIDTAGDITGAYTDTNGAGHGFVRAAGGAITAPIDAPGAVPGTILLGKGQAVGGTFLFGINPGGSNTTGAYSDANGAIHGFMRAANGAITAPIDAPGAGTGLDQGTAAGSIDDSGAIAGTYLDSNGVLHGFLLTPAMVASATLSPASLAFGNQAIDTTSATKKVTLTSSGNANLALSGIAITGADMGDFAQTNNCPPTLAPTKKCTINVTFRPTQTGSRTASLTVSDNAANSPQAVALTGTGVAQAAVSPGSLTFAAQKVGTKSGAKIVTLSNNLSTALAISSITFTGANTGDFAETDTCDGSVPAKHKCTISVTFAPAATGTRTTTLKMVDSANNSPQTVSVKGTGK